MINTRSPKVPPTRRPLSSLSSSHLQQWIAFCLSLLSFFVDAWAVAHMSDMPAGSTNWFHIPQKDLLWVAEAVTALAACALLPFAFESDSELREREIRRHHQA